MNARDAIARWNMAHPPGTQVALRKDNGQIRETRTSSLAYESAGVAVVRLDGMIGPCVLERVTVVVKIALPLHRAASNEPLELFAQVSFGELGPFVDAKRGAR